MAKRSAKLYHPANGHPVEIWQGYSWPCLAFGGFWYIYKGMALWGVGAFVLATMTFGLSWLLMPFHANEQHVQHLLKQGYLTRKQAVERGLVATEVAA